MKHYKIGFSLGVFDMFNIKDLNILFQAKKLCDFLIVGVITEDLYYKLYSKLPIINENDRMAIVEAVRCVDKVLPLCDLNINKTIQAVNADVLLISSSFHNDLLSFENMEFSHDYSVLYIDESDGIISPPSFITDDLASIHSKNQIVGYTTGVFDMFHIGHLNILKRAKEHCDYLIVGVSTDENVNNYKHKTPIIPFSERASIIRSIRYVDQVVPQVNMDKFAAWKVLHFDEMYHGDDWKGTQLYDDIELKLKGVGCRTVYLPHTDGISSTQLKELLDHNITCRNNN